MKHLMVINHFMTMNPQTNQIWIKMKQYNKRKGSRNGIHGKGKSKNHKITINNFPGGTSAMILENINQLVKTKPDCLIVHTGTTEKTY